MSTGGQHWQVRQEEDAPAYRKIGLTAAGTVAIMAALVAWAALAVRSSESDLRPGRAFPEQRLRPRPDLPMVQQELYGDFGVAEVLADEQRAALSRFEWVDADAGVARIPIEHAMELVTRSADAGGGAP